MTDETKRVVGVSLDRVGMLASQLDEDGLLHTLGQLHIQSLQPQTLNTKP